MTESAPVRLGVDVGGTNTDAVVLRAHRIVGVAKARTSADVHSGIVAAVRIALDAARMRATDVAAVMIGTTQFTNAFVQAKALNRVGVIRLAYPASTAIPPFSDWPARLAGAVDGGARILPGGYEFDGRELNGFDAGAVRDVVSEFAGRGIRAVAISSAFAPLNRAMEDRAASLVRERLPDAHVSLSADFGRIGLLERENAAIMNAALADVASSVVAAYGTALGQIGLRCPLFISQNDGTVMSASEAARYPVLTFASGPTNSMRGAAMLAGVGEGIVVDIGGTTTDVGFLQHGFPRESSLSVDIGGVRTNFRMPDILSIGIGGGSRVLDGPDVRVGPDSVGSDIVTRALIFGGDTLTATDVAVAAGIADIGDRSRVRHLSAALIDAALHAIRGGVEEAIDRMKTESASVPAILVGGGRIIVEGDLRGVAPAIVPEHYAVANALGAAMGQAGGETDRCFDYERMSRDEVLAEARREATERAVESGAVAATVRITDVEEVPLAYLPGRTVRVRVRAVGDMKLEAAASRPEAAR